MKTFDIDALRKVIQENGIRRKERHRSRKKGFLRGLGLLVIAGMSMSIWGFVRLGNSQRTVHTEQFSARYVVAAKSATDESMSGISNPADDLPSPKLDEQPDVHVSPERVSPLAKASTNEEISSEETVSGTTKPTEIVSEDKTILEANPKPSKGSSKYRIQLASTPDEASARKERYRLARRYYDELKGLSLVVDKSESDGTGVVYRILTSDIPDRRAVNRVCRNLEKMGKDCEVIENAGP